MMQRKYLFPGVIEMNYQAGRRLGVNVYLIDGGDEFVLIDIGYEDTVVDVIDHGAIALLGLHQGRVAVAIVQESTCLTVLTWNQFEPRLGEFGRSKTSRKWGRLLSRLATPLVNPTEPPGDQDPQPKI